MHLSHAAKADSYVADVLAGRIPACKWVKLACKRHLKDLERSESPEFLYRYDPEKADRVCRFISKLPHVEGSAAVRDPKTKKIPRLTLEPWQCFIISQIFGWVKKSNGRRRFRKAHVYVPRKNGKSLLAAGVGWWMFAKDNEPGAEICCGATSEKQAFEVLEPAQKMGRFVPELCEATESIVHAKHITRADGSKFYALVGDPGDGGNPHCAIVDEYHEHADDRLYETMKTGTVARAQSLILVVSTAGFTLSGPCREDWKDCEKLLDGTVQEETKFAIIYTTDEGDRWDSADALAKANPNWGVSVDPETVLPELEKAIRSPRHQAAFKTKHLNLWVSASNGWLNMEKWNACGDSSLSIDDFAGCDCWIGVDAASKVDIFSIAAVFRKDGKKYVFARHFLPQDTVSRPENKHYQSWVAEGWLTATEGARTDQRAVEDVLKEWHAKFCIREIVYDPRELTYMMSQVQEWIGGVPLVELTQGANLMSQPMKELEATVESGTFRHQCDPVLTWMASNVVRKEARGGGPVKYYYPTKESNANKIDGIVATIMAIAREMQDTGGGAGIYIW